MKKLFKLSAITAVFIGMSACEELKGLADVEFGVPYEHVANVDIETATEPDGSANFAISNKLNLFELEGMEEYKELVKDVTVTKIQLMSTNITAGEASLFTGALAIGGDNAIAIPNFEISEGAFVEITDENGFFGIVSDLLLANSEIDYSLNLNISDVPAKFDLKITMEFSVKASPLDSL